MKKDDFSTSLYKAIKNTISTSFKQTLPRPTFKEWKNSEVVACIFSLISFLVLREGVRVCHSISYQVEIMRS